VIEPEWLDTGDVVLAQRVAIDLFGGLHGVREMGALESAVAQPRATLGAEWVHPTVFDQAAAYAFQICRNHPFNDGNKRAGLMAASVFLGLNGWFLAEADPELSESMLAVVAGTMDKPTLSALLGRLATRRGEHGRQKR
jgi:death on curing protein